MSAVDKFLDAIDGTTIPYVEVTEDAKNPYCDSCSEAIRPNRKVQLYGTNKLIDGRAVPNGFRLLRLHCEDCFLPELYLPCEGFAEYLIEAEVDTEWTIHDPSFVDVSGSDDGIPYDPVTIIEDLFGMDYQKILAISGYESQGPLDVIDVLLTVDIDPREVVYDDGNITVTVEHRAKFHEHGGRLLEEHEAGEFPPQPSTTEKLRAHLSTEPAEE